MSGMLRVYSEHFDVRSFMDATNWAEETREIDCEIEVDVLSKQRLKRDPAAKPISGFQICVTSGNFDPLPQQQQEALQFLKRYKHLLIPVTEFGGEGVLDFGINARITSPRVGAQFDYFNADLIRLLGEIGFGLELSQYDWGRPKHPGYLRNRFPIIKLWKR